MRNNFVMTDEQMLDYKCYFGGLKKGLLFVWIMGLFFLISGCTSVSVSTYRKAWDPVPASRRIEANVKIVTECKMSEDYRRFWKSWLNSESNIDNFLHAQCDSILDDMTGSNIFRKVISADEQNYDLLIKLESLDSNQSIKVNLSIMDSKSRNEIAAYDGRASSEADQNRWANAMKGLLANIRNQMITDYLEGGGVKSYLIAKGTINERVVHPQLEQPQYKAAIKSDVDNPPVIMSAPIKKAYAIVIGIENYRQNLPKADFAASDASLVSEYLIKAMGYPEENVVTLLNEHASKSDFEKYFEKWLSNNVEKDSFVFIYFSGHGAPNPKTGDAYLVPYDGDPAFIDQTGYSLKRMYDALGKLSAKEVIVALDSCFSGAGGRSVIAKGTRPLVITMSNIAIPKKIAVLSAASGDQISSTYEEKGHGLFTYFMLKGIKNENVVKQDGSLAVNNLFSYLKPQVERIARKKYNNEQTPQLIMPKK